MPIYTYKCNNTNCKEFLKPHEHHVINPSHLVHCELCGDVLERMFPLSVHITSYNGEKDGRDMGKVTKEKNESLKKKWSGYSYEDQNLRKKINKMVEEKIGKNS